MVKMASAAVGILAVCVCTNPAAFRNCSPFYSMLGQCGFFNAARGDHRPASSLINNGIAGRTLSAISANRRRTIAVETSGLVRFAQTGPRMVRSKRAAIWHIPYGHTSRRRPAATSIADTMTRNPDRYEPPARIQLDTHVLYFAPCLLSWLFA